MPDCCPPYQPRHRRYHHLAHESLFERNLETLAQGLNVRGKFDLSERFIEGRFMEA
jgi:hypothetical protein